jgi:hypothetical protein
MSHRDGIIKKNKELSKPMDLFNVGFVGNIGSGGALEASGGTESETGGYKYHTFSSDDSSNQTVGTLTISAGSADIEYLIVAGGGGSGNFYSGGGGAGGMLTGTLTDQGSNVVAHVGLKGSAGAGGSFSPRGVQFRNGGITKTVVGGNFQNCSLFSHSSLSGLTMSSARGYSQNAINQLTGYGFAGHQSPWTEAHQVDENVGGNGQNSWIVANSTTTTAIGGGYGGYGGDGSGRNGSAGSLGGSGGGAGKNSSGGSGTSLQGNTGGNGGSGDGAGGGAGSAQAGGVGSSGTGGYGGNGTTWNGTIYAGGGFGGGSATHSSGAGDGQANAGGGANGRTNIGDGDTTALTVGNAGNNGIVILRYAV